MTFLLSLTIAGLFVEDEYWPTIVFDRIVQDYNISATYKLVPPNNPSQCIEQMCSLLEFGVIAIFDRLSNRNSQTVQSISDTKEIPRIETQWKERQLRSSTTINLYPYAPTLSSALADIVRELGWEEFTIFYEDNEGLVRISELLKTNDRYTIGVYQLDANKTGNYR